MSVFFINLVSIPGRRKQICQREREREGEQKKGGGGKF